MSAAAAPNLMHGRRPPAAALVPVVMAAAFAAASVIARRLQRRQARGDARPSVDWKLSVLSGNSITLRPTAIVVRRTFSRRLWHRLSRRGR